MSAQSSLDLAEDAGIVVPGRQLVRVDGSPVLLLDRFDREHGRRVGYISAMTLLEARDGQPADYTDIAEILPEHSSATAADLRQLWRRIAFSVAIHNTDDDLRNHGFLRHKAVGHWLRPLISTPVRISRRNVSPASGALPARPMR